MLISYLIELYKDVYSEDLTSGSGTIFIKNENKNIKSINSVFHFLNSYEEGQQVIQCFEKLIGIDLRNVHYQYNKIGMGNNLFPTLFSHISSEETFYKLIENELSKGVNPKYFALFLEWNKSVLPPNIIDSMEEKDVKN